MSRLMIGAAGSLLILATLLGVISTWQRRLMYFPTRDVPTPAQVGLSDVESITFETADGLRLNGWFLPLSGPSPRVTVLVLNGNGGNRGYRAPLAIALHRHGFQVALVDYRGYGENAGEPSEAGLAVDSRAARAYLARRPDVDPSRLVYFGESLGTAVAVDLAAEHPPASLILRSPFTSMVDVGKHHYPLMPVGSLLKDRYEAIERIARIHAPLLVIAGERDRIVPIALSRRLYDAANEPKTLLALPFADHNDYDLLAGNTMIQAIVRFLEPLRHPERTPSKH
jgi:fermentation-respiration switch protein FrsA (DUF1100 family)